MNIRWLRPRTNRYTVPAYSRRDLDDYVLCLTDGEPGDLVMLLDLLKQTYSPETLQALRRAALKEIPL